MPLVGASCFPNLFSQVPSQSLLYYVFENSVTIIREPYSLNWHTFLISALSVLYNDTLHYWYFVTALKWLFTILSFAFASADIGNVSKTKRSFQVWKLVESYLGRYVLQGIYSDYWLLEVYVSQSSVATQLRCGEIFNSHLIANCSQNVVVFVVRIGQYLAKIWTLTKWKVFFGTQCVYLNIPVGQRSEATLFYGNIDEIGESF